MLLCDGAHANRETAILVVGHYLYSMYMECETTRLGETAVLPTHSLETHMILHIYTVQVVYYHQHGRFTIRMCTITQQHKSSPLANVLDHAVVQVNNTMRP